MLVQKSHVKDIEDKYDQKAVMAVQINDLGKYLQLRAVTSTVRHDVFT